MARTPAEDARIIGRESDVTEVVAAAVDQVANPRFLAVIASSRDRIVFNPRK